ncbi:MAG: hypothetical protein IPG95_05630, partial [Saprospiraceae bacterium]|nr:hypothetical protein [Saprospiraceae bacterium]
TDNVSATDNCSTSFTGHNLQRVEHYCHPVKELPHTVTVTANDGNGNSSTYININWR